MYIWLHCKECGEDVEVYSDGENAMMCPECRSVDCFEEVEEFNPEDWDDELEDGMPWALSDDWMDKE